MLRFDLGTKLFANQNPSQYLNQIHLAMMNIGGAQMGQACPKLLLGMALIFCGQHFYEFMFLKANLELKFFTPELQVTNN